MSQAASGKEEQPFSSVFVNDHQK